MMRRANVGKPKDQWKPPEGYKSALGKARDAARAKEKKPKVASLESGYDTASDDDDCDESGDEAVLDCGCALLVLDETDHNELLYAWNFRQRTLRLPNVYVLDSDLMQAEVEKKILSAVMK